MQFWRALDGLIDAPKGRNSHSPGQSAAACREAPPWVDDVRDRTSPERAQHGPSNVTLSCLLVCLVRNRSVLSKLDHQRNPSNTMSSRWPTFLWPTYLFRPFRVGGEGRVLPHSVERGTIPLWFERNSFFRKTRDGKTLLRHPLSQAASYRRPSFVTFSEASIATTSRSIPLIPNVASFSLNSSVRVPIPDRPLSPVPFPQVQGEGGIQYMILALSYHKWNTLLFSVTLGRKPEALHCP